MGLKNLSKVCHIDKFWVVISMVPKTTSLRLSRRVSVAKLVKRLSSRTKQYMSVSNYFYFFPPKNAKKFNTGSCSGKLEIYAHLSTNFDKKENNNSKQVQFEACTIRFTFKIENMLHIALKTFLKDLHVQNSQFV